MSKTVKAWAATSPHKTEPITIERRAPDENDVTIQIKYAGICHSDIHTIRGDWGAIAYPQTVGHEIAGVVSAVGANVSKFKVGDCVGVGTLVNSCRTCANCVAGKEQYCFKGPTATYNSKDPKEGGKITQGGYSEYIVVDQAYVLHLPDSVPMEVAAPLLCAGITVYSPLKHWGVGPGKRVGVVGLGGLGHLAVKFGHALGAEVTIFSQTLGKKELGLKLGADHYYATGDNTVFDSPELKHSLDLIINTVSSKIPLDQYLSLLTSDGTLVEVGMPEQPLQIAPFMLAYQRLSVAGSVVGGIRETQEMLEYCGEKGIFPEVEIIGVKDIENAYERVVKSQVQFRFVIDVSTM